MTRNTELLHRMNNVASSIASLTRQLCAEEFPHRDSLFARSQVDRRVRTQSLTFRCVCARREQDAHALRVGLINHAEQHRLLVLSATIRFVYRAQARGKRANNAKQRQLKADTGVSNLVCNVGISFRL